VFAVVRAMRKLRRQLDVVEPLPTDTVEARRRRRRLTWKRVGLTALSLAVTIQVTVSAALVGEQWLPRLAAAAIAVASTQTFLRPLAEAFLVSRWERAHGGGRLFQPAVFTDKDVPQELYVAHRPVPAA
jgi:hypothetical protein